jgi:hypothetical protein
MERWFSGEIAALSRQREGIVTPTLYHFCPVVYAGRMPDFESGDRGSSPRGASNYMI